MSSMERARFSSLIEELPKMLLWIRNHLIHEGMDLSSIRKIELATEEAIVNVVLHAYKDQKGEIELVFHRCKGKVEIAIIDYGPPFNPLLSSPEVDALRPLEEREEGGLGIFLMRKCVDEILYRREGSSNVLTLSKRFSQMK